MSDYKDNVENNKTGLTDRMLPRLYSFLKLFFCFFIAVSLVYYIVSKDKDISEVENRPLQKRPSFTVSSFIDGSFMDNMEKWLSDQFPLRDGAVSLKTLIDRTLGKKEENGVYFGKDGFLFEKGSVYDEKLINKAKYLLLLQQSTNLGDITKMITDEVNALKQLKEGMKSKSISIDFIPSTVFTDIFFLHDRPE